MILQLEEEAAALVAVLAEMAFVRNHVVHVLLTVALVTHAEVEHTRPALEGSAAQMMDSPYVQAV